MKWAILQIIMPYVKLIIFILVVVLGELYWDFQLFKNNKQTKKNSIIL